MHRVLMHRNLWCSALALVIVLSAAIAPAPAWMRAGSAGAQAFTPPGTVHLSGWAPVAPTADGTAGATEWANAGSAVLPHGRLLFKNDGVNLYGLIDVTGDNANDPPLSQAPWGDFIWLTFDVDRDAAIDANLDVNYGIFPGSTTFGRQFYLGASTWTGLQATQAQLAEGFGASPGSAAAHRFWEVTVPFSEIQGFSGGIARMGVKTYSQNPFFDDNTPSNFSSDFTNLILVHFAPNVAPAATSVVQGGQLSVTGNGFAPNNPTTISLVDPSEANPTVTLGTATPNAAYSFTQTFTLPTATLPTVYYVKACQFDGEFARCANSLANVTVTSAGVFGIARCEVEGPLLTDALVELFS